MMQPLTDTNKSGWLRLTISAGDVGCRDVLLPVFFEPDTMHSDT